MVTHFRAARKRLAREHNSRLTAAYYGGLIPHIKNAPTLKELMLPEEAVPRAQNWQQIKAAFMAAMPPLDPQKPKVKNGRRQ